MDDKRKGFFRYLYQSYFGLSVLTLIIVFSMAFKLINDISIKEVERNLVSQSILIEELVSIKLKELSPSIFSSYVQQLSEDVDIRFTFIDKAGDVLFDTQVNVRDLDNQHALPEVQDAFSYGKGVSKRYSQSSGDTLLFYAFRLHEKDKFNGVLRLSAPIMGLPSYTMFFKEILIGIFLSLLCTGLFAFSCSKQFKNFLSD